MNKDNTILLANPKFNGFMSSKCYIFVLYTQDNTVKFVWS